MNEGEIMSDVETVRLKRLAQINPTKSEISDLDSDTEVSFVALEDFGTDGEIKEAEPRPLEDVYSGYTYFRNGDIAIAKITPSFENGKGAICEGLKNDIGFGTTELHVLRPRNNIDKKYIWYVLRSKLFKEAAKAAMRGVAGQQRVPTEFIEEFEAPYYPLKKQREIVEYIENRIGRFESLIDTQRELLNVLEEKLNAEITRAISNGINPDVNTKKVDSKWIDEIPSHWEVARLNHLRDTYTPIVYGIILPGPNQDEGVPIIKGGDCKPEKLDPDKLSKTTEEKAAEYERSRLDEGDIVYEIRGSVGGVIKVPSELEGANLTQDTARISPSEDICSDWLVYALRSHIFSQQMDLHTRGATVEGVNLYHLRRGVLPVPPVSEQKQIADYLEQIDDRIRDLCGKIQDEIKVLQEKRQALITAAVTGQIDVTEAQSEDQEILQ